MISCPPHLWTCGVPSRNCLQEKWPRGQLKSQGSLGNLTLGVPKGQYLPTHLTSASRKASKPQWLSQCQQLLVAYLKTYPPTTPQKKNSQRGKKCWATIIGCCMAVARSGQWPHSSMCVTALGCQWAVKNKCRGSSRSMINGLLFRQERKRI